MTPENIAKVRELRALGVSVEKIGRQLGLSRGAVEYQLLSPERRLELSRLRVRANRVEYVTYDCPGCGEMLRIQKETRKRHARLGKPGYCRDCVRSLRYRGCVSSRQEVVAAYWMSPEERLDPKVWAERVAAMMSPGELRLIAMLEPSDLDGSRFARPENRRRRWVEREERAA